MTDVVFSDGLALPANGVFAGPEMVGTTLRETLTLHVSNCTHAELAQRFVTGAAFSLRVTSGEAQEGAEAQTYDKAEYCLAGRIIDERDGTFTVKMHAKTPQELTVEAAQLEAAALFYRLMTGEEMS